MESIPYKEDFNDNFYLRTFNQDTPDQELKWHFDDENRKIIPTKGDSWKIQIDESLPEELKIGKEYFIPVDVYHRVIKGNGDLEIKLYKLDSTKGEYPKHTRTYSEDKRFSDNFLYHINNNIKLYQNIFRYGSDAWCDMVQEAKELYEKDLIELDEEEIELINNDSGKIVFIDNEKYVLNTPFKNTDEDSEHEFFVYICDDNKKIRKIKFNAE